MHGSSQYCFVLTKIACLLNNLFLHLQLFSSSHVEHIWVFLTSLIIIIIMSFQKKYQSPLHFRTLCCLETYIHCLSATVCSISAEDFWEQIMEIQITISISCQWPTYLFTIDPVSLEIGCWSRKKTPVSALVVCDISFHLVLNNFIWQEHAFNPCNLRIWEVGSGTEKHIKKTRRKKITKNIYLYSNKGAGFSFERTYLKVTAFLTQSTIL